MNKRLILHVEKQIAADNRGELEQIFTDVCNYGADAGFNGFIYYSETIDFFNENKTLIMKEVKEMAESLDEDPLQMIANFNCLKDMKLSTMEIAEAIYDNPTSESAGIVKNALAWFALEEVARFVCEK
jgi:hypothetical protein